ncbi:hypothetical protein NDU88_008538 [Pleurodeles waltl]|uniref:Uncharacterized protein n=1 Tax=Pleurodeles waltl TaxID=8319 RepID=A0AAV7QS32_PLEWA|nr:hypothetical protein NDU88_008538 [Pleurodeles waltl]
MQRPAPDTECALGLVCPIRFSEVLGARRIWQPRRSAAQLNFPFLPERRPCLSPAEVRECGVHVAVPVRGREAATPGARMCGSTSTSEPS